LSAGAQEGAAHAVAIGKSCFGPSHELEHARVGDPTALLPPTICVSTFALSNGSVATLTPIELRTDPPCVAWSVSSDVLKRRLYDI
jgi:hypothetical protein